MAVSFSGCESLASTPTALIPSDLLLGILAAMVTMGLNIPRSFSAGRGNSVVWASSVSPTFSNCAVRASATSTSTPAVAFSSLRQLSFHPSYPHSGVCSARSAILGAMVNGFGLTAILPVASLTRISAWSVRGASAGAGKNT